MDEIVSAVYYEGSVLVLTTTGYVYELLKNRNTEQIEYRFLFRMKLGLT